MNEDFSISAIVSSLRELVLYIAKSITNNITFMLSHLQKRLIITTSKFCIFSTDIKVCLSCYTFNAYDFGYKLINVYIMVSCSMLCYAPMFYHHYVIYLPLTVCSFGILRRYAIVIFSDHCQSCIVCSYLHLTRFYKWTVNSLLINSGNIFIFCTAFVVFMFWQEHNLNLRTVVQIFLFLDRHWLKMYTYYVMSTTDASKFL